MSRFKNFINFFKSLKFRLILFLILFGIVPGIVLKVGIVKTYEDRSVSIKTSEILSQAKILANQIVSNDYLNYPNSTIINAELDQLSNIYDRLIRVKIIRILDNVKLIIDHHDTAIINIR